MKNLTELEFKDHVLMYENEYEKKMLLQFFEYWTEPNRKGKMKWELEKTWDTKRRLKRWFDNQNKWNGKIINGKATGAHELLEELRANSTANR